MLLPGVQVLFAFLLTLPFTGRFDTLTTAEEALYFIAFCSTALAAVLLITPGVQHRLRWRQHDKEHILQFGNRYAIAGTAFLATAIVSVVLLVSEYLYGWTMGVPVSVVVAGMILLPLVCRPHLPRSHRRRPALTAAHRLRSTGLGSGNCATALGRSFIDRASSHHGRNVPCPHGHTASITSLDPAPPRGRRLRRRRARARGGRGNPQR